MRWDAGVGGNFASMLRHAFVYLQRVEYIVCFGYKQMSKYLGNWSQLPLY